MSKFVKIGLLKNYPVSRPNADDSGEQKDCVFGGSRRSRISSQCLKRMVREFWHENMDAEKVHAYHGIRTQMILKRIINKLDFVEDEKTRVNIANAIVNTVFDKKRNSKKGKENLTSCLIFTSDKEIDSIIDRVVVAMKEDDFDIKNIKKILHGKPIGITVDVAMFGRMQATVKTHEVYAAVQVAHAMGVNALAEEFDYFTAIDDLKIDSGEEDTTGAGHLGSLSFNSSCYYQYASICVDKLMENLDDANLTAEACAEFISAFAMDVPKGKANTFANNVVPALVVVDILDTQPNSDVNAFETPVVPNHKDKESLTDVAIRNFFEYRQAVEETFGNKPSHTFVCSLKDIDGKMSLQEVCEKVVDTLKG